MSTVRRTVVLLATVAFSGLVALAAAPASESSPTPDGGPSPTSLVFSDEGQPGSIVDTTWG